MRLSANAIDLDASVVDVLLGRDDLGEAVLLGAEDRLGSSLLGHVDEVQEHVPRLAIDADQGSCQPRTDGAAISVADADALAGAVAQAGVSSVVFFTARFQADVRAWLAEVSATGGWAGGCAVWLGSALRAGNPFNTPWRRDKGGLWDVAPHLVSLLWASLGPVRSVTAEAGLGDVTHLVLHHEDRVTSTVTVTLNVPMSAGLRTLPMGRSRPVTDASNG